MLHLNINKELFKVLKTYIPMFFLVCFSGNPIITNMGYSKGLFIGFTAIFFIHTIFIIDLQMLKKVLGIFSVVVVSIFTIIFFQQMILGFVSFPGVFYYIIKIVFSLSLLIYFKHIKADFIEAYIKVITFLAIVSIPLWMINHVGYFGIDTDSVNRKSLLFYTSVRHIPGRAIIRNPGMFWEPGAYAGYLIVALVFIALKNRKFQIGPYKKEVIWIILALLTTMSTAGFVVFGAVLMFYSIQNYRLGKLIIIPVMILIMSILYNNMDFLKEKIERQYTEAIEMDEDDVSANRMGALVMDLQYIRAQPLIGNGLHVKTRYRFHPQVKGDIGHGNGMSHYMAAWGIPFFLFWLFCVFKFSKQISHSNKTATIAIIIILLLLQSQQYLNYPLFISFFFLPFVYKNILADRNKIHIVKTYFALDVKS
jgi:hypothetical protein